MRKVRSVRLSDREVNILVDVFQSIPNACKWLALQLSKNVDVDLQETFEELDLSIVSGDERVIAITKIVNALSSDID